MKDILTRSIKTLVQAFFAYFLANLATVNFDDGYTVLKAVITGSFAAGICAAWNGVLYPMLNKHFSKLSKKPIDVESKTSEGSK